MVAAASALVSAVDSELAVVVDVVAIRTAGTRARTELVVPTRPVYNGVFTVSVCTIDARAVFVGAALRALLTLDGTVRDALTERVGTFAVAPGADTERVVAVVPVRVVDARETVERATLFAPVRASRVVKLRVVFVPLFVMFVRVP